jgi:hypothetical protein
MNIRFMLRVMTFILGEKIISIIASIPSACIMNQNICALKNEILRDWGTSS